MARIMQEFKFEAAMTMHGTGKTDQARTGTSRNHDFARYFCFKNTRFRIYQKPGKYRIQQTGQALPSRPGPPGGAPVFKIANRPTSYGPRARSKPN